MIKALEEKRANLLNEMQDVMEGARKETRALSEDEEKKFSELKNEVERIDRTIEKENEMRSFDELGVIGRKEKEEKEDVEIRAFASVIRNRSDENITKSDNGAVIPKTIAQKIVDQVKDISPLYAMSEKFDQKGVTGIPYVDAENDNIVMGYAEEFVDLEAKGEKLASVNLEGKLAGVLTKISQSLLNNTDLDLTNHVIGKLAMARATFLDREIIAGTTPNKIIALSAAKNKLTAAKTNELKADELIELQDMLKSAYQRGAIWVMNPKTFTQVKLLKDGNGKYLLNDLIMDGFSGILLGKPVYTSDQFDEIAAGKNVIAYLDPKNGLATKTIEESIQPLREKYAIQHALGIVEWGEYDAKIQNEQAVAMLKMKSA